MTGGRFTHAREAAARALASANASVAVAVMTHDPTASTTAAPSVAEQKAVPPNAPPPKKAAPPNVITEPPPAGGEESGLCVHDNDGVVDAPDPAEFISEHPPMFYLIMMRYKFSPPSDILSCSVLFFAFFHSYFKTEYRLPLQLQDRPISIIK